MKYSNYLYFRDFENYQNFQVKDSAKNGKATERLEELAKPKKNFVETQVRKMDEHYWLGSENFFVLQWLITDAISVRISLVTLFYGRNESIKGGSL